MLFGCNKRNLNQETFYLDKNQNEITHQYKYPGIDSYSHGHFEPSYKMQRIACMKVVMCTLRKETVVGFTGWELEIPSIEDFGAPTFTYGIEIWGDDLENSHWKVFEKAMQKHMMSHVKVHSLTT
jgi:hypothetical protein